jgi:hypothetical protein
LKLWPLQLFLYFNIGVHVSLICPINYWVLKLGHSDNSCISILGSQSAWFIRPHIEYCVISA